jgi:peroxiredoxin
VGLSTRHVEVVPRDWVSPTPNITAGPTKTRISRVAGQDSFTVDWQSDEGFSHYQIRVVSSGSDTYVQGTLLEMDENPASGGNASTTYTATITDDELVAASAVEGANILKVFVQDNAGNWSV